jgi:hypothetical protein
MWATGPTTRNEHLVPRDERATSEITIKAMKDT